MKINTQPIYNENNLFRFFIRNKIFDIFKKNIIKILNKILTWVLVLNFLILGTTPFGHPREPQNLDRDWV